MIDHVTGQLIEVHDETIVVERSGIGYQVAVPRYALGELAARRGREVTLHTLLFIEGNQTGGYLEPVLVGFPHPEDKLFFRRFVSVKGIGFRKALKALAEPVGRIAAWIEQGDRKGIARLPGIGARAADLIVAELKGKMKDLALGGVAPAEPMAGWKAAQRDALEIMLALGDSRNDVVRWLERAAQLHPQIESPDDWVRAAYKIKTGVES